MKTARQLIFSPKKSLPACSSLLALFLLLLGVQTGLVCKANATGSIASLAAGSKQVLNQSDFEYIGAFLLPISGVNGDAAWGQGLAHRYVNGELRMFAYAWNPTSAQNMYEVKVPTPSLTSAPTATVVRNWGDIAGSKRVGQMFGLYWDEQDRRIYWNDQNIYNTCCPDDPGMGYSTLNDTTGAITIVGAWRFTGRGTKAINTCVLPIPQWFADAYTGGRRLGAGCGGYQSIIANRPCPFRACAHCLQPSEYRYEPRCVLLVVCEPCRLSFSE